MKKIILYLLPLFLFSKNTLAGQKNIYDFQWLDPDKAVYVLQNKIYEKKNSFYFNVGYGQSLTADFVSAKNIQFKTGYYFTEEWGFEIVYSTISNSTNTTFDNISRSNDRVVPFIRQEDGYYGALLIFSPFYAKINTFNKIVYLDWSFGLGFGKVDGKSNKTAFRTEDQNVALEEESNTAFLGKTQFKIFFTELLHFNIDIFVTTYKPEPALEERAKSFFVNTDLILSFGFGL